MKKLMLACAAAIVLFNSSCLPDKCCEPPLANSYINAQRNGIQWSAYPENSAFKNDTLTISGVGENPGPAMDTISFRIKYIGPGKYELLKNQVAYFYTAGHSAPVVSYTLDSSYDNNLNIVSYDQTENMVNGTFNIKFAGTNNTADVSFLDGGFHIVLHN